MLRSFSVYFLFSLAGLQAAAAKDSFQANMAAGDRYFKAFDDQKALKYYEAAHAMRPDDYEAAIKLLRTNNNIGQSLKDNKADPELVRSYFEKNVVLAEDLNKKHPDKAEAPFSLAISYGNLALYSSAREKVQLSRDIEANLKRSIALDPKFPYSYLGLGIFYREVSKITFIERFFANLLFGAIPSATLEDAEKNFKLSFERDPNFIFAHYHYAICLEDDGRPAEAMVEYQKVLDLPRTESIDLPIKRISREALKRLQADSPQTADSTAAPSANP